MYKVSSAYLLNLSSASKSKCIESTLFSVIPNSPNLLSASIVLNMSRQSSLESSQIMGNKTPVL